MRHTKKLKIFLIIVFILATLLKNHEAKDLYSSIKVSVIVPVYNTSDYLKDCLDCITSQSLKNIEIICIDDGSTDN